MSYQAGDVTLNLLRNKVNRNPYCSYSALASNDEHASNEGLSIVTFCILILIVLFFSLEMGHGIPFDYLRNK